MSFDRITNLDDGKEYKVNLAAGTTYCTVPKNLWLYVLSFNPYWVENIRREAAREHPDHYRGCSCEEGETLEQARERQFARFEKIARERLEKARLAWRKNGSITFDNIRISGITLQDIIRLFPPDVFFTD